MVLAFPSKTTLTSNTNPVPVPAETDPLYTAMLRAASHDSLIALVLKDAETEGFGRDIVKAIGAYTIMLQNPEIESLVIQALHSRAVPLAVVKTRT